MRNNIIRTEQNRTEQNRTEQNRTEQNRDSNFELLRIFAMFMIIAHHFSVHGGFEFPKSLSDITINRLWTQFILMGGGLGNDIFVLISGYFLVKSRAMKVSKVFDLWLRMFFYSVGIFAIFTLTGLEKFVWLDFVKSLLPPITGWWFASCYFLLYLLHPYMNITLNSLTKSEYKRMLIIFGICWCIIPTFLKSNFQSSNLIWFMYLYSLAGYVRLWCEDLCGKKYFMFALLLTVVNFAGAVLLDLLGLKFPFLGRPVIALYYYANQHLLTISIAFCLFVGFRSLRVKYSALINTIASATFGVYLIHDNAFVRRFLWLKLFRNAEFFGSRYFIAYSLAAILIVYAVCVMIELLRMRIFAIICTRK